MNCISYAKLENLAGYADYKQTIASDNHAMRAFLIQKTVNELGVPLKVYSYRTRLTKDGSVETFDHDRSVCTPGAEIPRVMVERAILLGRVLDAIPEGTVLIEHFIGTTHVKRNGQIRRARRGTVVASSAQCEFDILNAARVNEIIDTGCLRGTPCVVESVKLKVPGHRLEVIASFYTPVVDGTTINYTVRRNTYTFDLVKPVSLSAAMTVVDDTHKCNGGSSHLSAGLHKALVMMSAGYCADNKTNETVYVRITAGGITYTYKVLSSDGTCLNVALVRLEKASAEASAQTWESDRDWHSLTKVTPSMFAPTYKYEAATSTFTPAHSSAEAGMQYAVVVFEENPSPVSCEVMAGILSDAACHKEKEN